MVKKKMSEDKAEAKTNTVSGGVEIGEIVRKMNTLSKEIANESTDIRKVLIQISDTLSPIFQRAGIRYGHTKIWQKEAIPCDLTYRLCVQKHKDKWVIVVERTEATPKYHDGSNFVGWEDPFSEEADEYGLIRKIGFDVVSRSHFPEIIEHIPDFLNEYVENLQKRHMKYADMKKKTNMILEALK